ncbi:MAG: hypothetical protein K9N55_02805 [Phycisphaerae bacterium]|nr:hypothetical protein [Phycisphaerae bacterium]
MKHMRFCLIVVMAGLAVPLHAASWQTDEFEVTVSDSGQVTSLLDKRHSAEYAAKGQPSPLLQARIAGQFRAPDRMTWHADTQRMDLHYGQATLVVAVETRDTHVNFELVEVTPAGLIDRVQWGPVATSIGQTVGEVIGVVRNDVFAVGLQGLNVKTLGGLSLKEEGRDPSRGQTARPMPWGSTLQAYSIDRSLPRHVSVWGTHFPNMPIPPIPGETCVGSKIALFGCSADSALDRVGTIELAEGLPHPMFNGIWSRKNPDLGRSYLIAEFSEDTVDEMLGYTQRGNFLSLYHGSPFTSWGHYELHPRFFPNGNAGMRQCVRKAKEKGILIGVHTLTNFINTNDSYVTPVPDPRLAKTGTSILTTGIDAEQTSIEVASPEYFANEMNWMRTVMVGTELVRYGKVSDQAPWMLTDCQRGVFGTQASSHAKGAEIAKLMDHPYKVFFPNYDMQHEIAERLARLFNETGIGHFDFDGHEGAWASGQGDFGLEVFAKTFYDHLDHFVHNGTSNSQPFYWHINTCCNWGEPWYGGFRSSMADYRINNQAMLERNFMPKMLGWFLLTPTTTLADIEWLMARSAGYHSGFAMATSLNALRSNPGTGAYLDAIRRWEALRMADAFTEAQRARMRDTDNEFHLRALSETEFRLHQYVKSAMFEYEHYQRQPGEPTGQTWRYQSAGETQPLQFQMQVEGEGTAADLTLEIDNYLRIEIPGPVQAGHMLICDGTKRVRVYDEKGRQNRVIELSTLPPMISEGAHDVHIECAFSGDPAPKVKIQFKSLDTGEAVSMTP